MQANNEEVFPPSFMVVEVDFDMDAERGFIRYFHLSMM
jgi:hypothetical protein